MKKSSIKVNILYQMLYEVLALALPLITSPYVSRVLGAENIGIYSYTYSIATYFGMFAMLGVKNHGNREIAKAKDNNKVMSRTFWSIYLIQFMMSIIMIGLYLIYVCFVVKEYVFFFLIQLLYVISYMTDINWLFFGMEFFKQTSLRNMFIKVMTFIATFIFVRDINDLWKYCLVLSVGALLSELILWIYVPKYICFVKPRKTDIVKNIRPMLILFIPVLATSIYCFMDKIMVGYLSTKRQLGFYENSEKITNCVKTVILAIGTVMMPRMTTLVAKNDVKKAERYMNLSIEIIMMLAFALSFGVSAVADVFAPIYWGREFLACGVLLKGLSVALPFSAFGNFIRTQYMIPHDMDKEYIIAVISSAMINALFNLLLIPNLGAIGAVIGTILAESGVCIIQCIFVRKYVRIGSFIRKSIPFLIAGVIMYFVVCWTALFRINGIVSLLLQILVGAAVYMLLCLIYFFVTKNEILYGLINKYKKDF